MDEYDRLQRALMRLGRMHFRWLHGQLEQFGLYPGQPQILHALARREGENQRDLAQMAHVRPPTMAVMLRRMAAAGLLERRGDQQDGRVQRVYLTAKGRDTEQKVAAAFHRNGAQLFARFTPEERHTLLELMEKLSYDFETVIGQEEPCENYSDI